MPAHHTDDPTLPVQQQLDAYNARDIEAFMRCWAEDCEYYAFPSTLLARGPDAVRARHETRFHEPNLFGHLRHRSAVGDIVVDHETVTRTFPDGPGDVDVLAIYQVAQGRIARAWVHMGPPRLHPPGHVTIRPAAARDAAAVRALTRSAYAKWVPVLNREPKPMGADYAAAVRNHRVDLLFRDGILAGLVELIPEPGHLLIENVAVAPAHQGQGLGRRLLEHAEHVAVCEGQHTIRLYTNGAFAENVRLYRAFGYAIDREERFMGGTTVFMSKRL